MTRSGWLLLVLLLSGCVSNPTQPGGEQDLLELRRNAAALYQARDFEKALPVYQELVQRVPRDALLWFRLGNLHARLKQPDEAIAAYRKAVRLNPQLDKAWHNMAILQLRQAANSLTQMIQYADPKGPLYQRAVTLSGQVIELLERRHDRASAR